MGDSPDKMTYTEQANKRQHCKRLTSFIRLCDYLITNTMHSLGKPPTATFDSALNNRNNSANPERVLNKRIIIIIINFLSRQFGIYPIGSIRRAVETFSNGI